MYSNERLCENKERKLEFIDHKMTAHEIAIGMTQWEKID